MKLSHRDELLISVLASLTVISAFMSVSVACEPQPIQTQKTAVLDAEESLQQIAREYSQNGKNKRSLANEHHTTETATTTTEVATETIPTTEVEATEFVYPLYKVNGKMMDEDLQIYLYKKLSEYGHEWFFETSLIQLYQESNFITDCITYRNGEGNNDCGLCQFKEKWWNWYCQEAGTSGDILDPYKQLDVYTFHVCSWLNEGYSENEALSRWYLGEYGISEEYLGQVLQWRNRLEKVR